MWEGRGKYNNTTMSWKGRDQADIPDGDEIHHSIEEGWVWIADPTNIMIMPSFIIIIIILLEVKGGGAEKRSTTFNNQLATRSRGGQGA